MSMGDRERAFGYLEGSRRVILVEPDAKLTETPKLPGLDGQKMSKSYGNVILMREEPKALTDKVRRMTTDPARVRRTDPGEPERCPVWQLHKIYSSVDTQQWAAQGCRTAGIGCLDCKQPVIEALLAEQQPWRERAQPYLDDPALLRSIVADGCDRARAAAQETMREVRGAMGLDYA
jgi:tryptophanyl-tRNA synthetase